MREPTVTRADWLAWLLALEGTPYQHQGRAPGLALDCVGPLICAAKHFGLKPAGFDIGGYSAQPDGSLQPLLDAHLERIDRADLRPGDVILNGFRLDKPRHIAVIVSEAWGQWVMLHADSVAGRVKTERIQYGRRFYRYVQGYRVPGVQP